MPTQNPEPARRARGGVLDAAGASRRRCARCGEGHAMTKQAEQAGDFAIFLPGSNFRLFCWFLLVPLRCSGRVHSLTFCTCSPASLAQTILPCRIFRVASELPTCSFLLLCLWRLCYVVAGWMYAPHPSRLPLTRFHVVLITTCVCRSTAANRPCQGSHKQCAPKRKSTTTP